MPTSPATVSGAFPCARLSTSTYALLPSSTAFFTDAMLPVEETIIEKRKELLIMSQETKKDVVSNKRGAIKKSTKIAMACPQCIDKPYPEEVEMKEEMVKGIVLGYFCRRCGYQVDVESITSLG
jgi:hypothetical protein